MAAEEHSKDKEGEQTPSNVKQFTQRSPASPKKNIERSSSPVAGDRNGGDDGPGPSAA